MRTELTIIVAVDNREVGYVLDFAGARQRPKPEHLSPHDAFSEEVSNSGRYCEDLLLDNPLVAGVHRFDGRMFYTCDADECEPGYEGSWTTLYYLPTL